MTHKPSPKVAGAVQARLAYLRRRKALLDDLIQSLERYSVHELPVVEAHEKAKGIAPRMAGAAYILSPRSSFPPQAVVT